MTHDDPGSSIESLLSQAENSLNGALQFVKQAQENIETSDLVRGFCIQVDDYCSNVHEAVTDLLCLLSSRP